MAKTVDDLLREMEPPAPARSAPAGAGGKQPPALPGAAAPRLPGRLLAAVLLLGMGFCAGWLAASLRAPLTAGAGAKGGMETRRDLLAAGWSEADQGVFTRRCQGNCRMPRLFGGGVVDVMEISCLERPCGEIRAVFDVLDGQGQVIETLPILRSGRQGERLQLELESERPEARRFVLREFRSRARVD